MVSEAGVWQDKPMLVEDATKDPQFVQNQLVQDGVVRFCYGVPLSVCDRERDRLGHRALFPFRPRPLINFLDSCSPFDVSHCWQAG